jgi:hypothetical protein
MAKYFIEDTTLINIADSIRAVTGSTGTIKVSDIAFKIENIGSEIKPVLQEKSVTPSESVQVVTSDDGYDALSSVTVDAVSSNYVGSGVDRVGATTIVPTTTSQIAVHAGSYVTGDIEVAAVESVEVENLDTEISEQDLLIEQIQAALEGKVAPSGGIDTSDATATATDIANGKTAYVNGNKIVGTHICSSGSGDSIGIDTCTINVYNDIANYGDNTFTLIVSTLNDNQVCIHSENVNGLSMISVHNVICGSLALIVPVDGYTFDTELIYMSMNNEYSSYVMTETYHFFTIPNESNVEISVYEN